MGDVLGVARSSLTPSPPTSSSITTLDTELALPARPLLETIDEPPAMAHDDMDLDSPLQEHDANEDENFQAGEGVEVKGDLDAEDK